MGKNKLISGIILVGTLAALSILVSLRSTDPPDEPYPVPESIDSIAEAEPLPPTPSHSGKVTKNANFFDLMLACSIQPNEIKEIERTSKPVYDFRRIYPGQSYEVYTDSSGLIERLKFSIDDEKFVEIGKDEGAITAEIRSYDFNVVHKTTSGLITHSLFTSLQEQSLPIEVGLKLSDIFAWDIDFFTDLHKNDYFRVVYEEKTRYDGMNKIGNIIAAEFNTQGNRHYAFLFENEAGLPDYFDETGKSLRKQLLKAPLSYTRISSSYSRKRFHPIRRRYAPHWGIDYSAPTGTPVMSTGDGTVITASRTRANGNYIKIRHNHNYITYYLHLSRFAKGMKPGTKVKQGLVIGYVGATGYATGPHLDYRVKKNGSFVNPRTLRLPPAKPVTEANMASFVKLRDMRLKHLHSIPIEDWRTEHYAGGDAQSSHGSMIGDLEETIPSHPYTSH